MEVRRACDGPVEMGSVRDHLENRKDCCVVVVGDSKVGPAGASGLSSQSGVGARQDLDQITTFSEILDSLKNYPSEKESKELNNMTKPKDMMYMAPLGPSQVDIGNLSSR